MSRRPSENEVRLILTLVGSGFDEIETVRKQLSSATVAELDNGSILEFHALVSEPLLVKEKVLGEGSLRDIDGTPIIFTLLQKDGYIWRLDISRADSGRIHRQLDYDAVVSLGFGNGLSLAWPNGE